MQLTPLQMEEILFTLCGGSVHIHQTEIAQGYVTLENGCRAGLGGRFLQNPEQGIVLQELTSVNLRIAREKTVPLPQELTAALRGHFIGMLLVGEPGSGKTTLLRSLVQKLCEGDALVSVIDERGELMACETGSLPRAAQIRCDVYARCTKPEGIAMALRCMNPQILVCDELGTAEDAQAVAQGVASGVVFFATVHCDTPAGLHKKPPLAALLATGAFAKAAFLSGRAHPGTVAQWVTL